MIHQSQGFLEWSHGNLEEQQQQNDENWHMANNDTIAIVDVNISKHDYATYIGRGMKDRIGNQIRSGS